MSDRKHIDYKRIEAAIGFIKANFKEQPNLDEVAAFINTSPFHFQRMFKDWAGVTPKKFTQYLSLNFAKELLNHNDMPLLDVAHATGLSGTSRLHDLFVTIEGMSPGEYKNGGQGLCINYQFADSPFGQMLIGSTSKGICHISFEEEDNCSLVKLMSLFPGAKFNSSTDDLQQSALSLFQKDWRNLDDIKLHLRGTAFQLKVWEALLKIPFGQFATYSDVAASVGHSNAHRAAGTAIGSNPVAYLIPCHRVIKKSGEPGQYRWGSTRKSAINGWEAAKVDSMV